MARLLALGLGLIALVGASPAEAHYLPLGSNQARFKSFAQAYCAAKGREFPNGSENEVFGCQQVMGPVICLRGRFFLGYNPPYDANLLTTGQAPYPLSPMEVPTYAGVLKTARADGHPIPAYWFDPPDRLGRGGELYPQAAFMGGVAYMKSNPHARAAHTATCLAMLYARSTMPGYDHYSQYLTGLVVMRRLGFRTTLVRSTISSH